MSIFFELLYELHVEGLVILLVKRLMNMTHILTVLKFVQANRKYFGYDLQQNYELPSCAAVHIQYIQICCVLKLGAKKRALRPWLMSLSVQS